MEVNLKKAIAELKNTINQAKSKALNGNQRLNTNQKEVLRLAKSAQTALIKLDYQLTLLKRA